MLTCCISSQKHEEQDFFSTTVPSRNETAGDRNTLVFSQAATPIFGDKFDQFGFAGNPKIIDQFSDKLFSVMGSVGIRMSCMLLTHQVFAVYWHVVEFDSRSFMIRFSPKEKKGVKIHYFH